MQRPPSLPPLQLHSTDMPSVEPGERAVLKRSSKPRRLATTPARDESLIVRS